MKKILIYVDEGAGPQSVRFLIKTLRKEGIDQQYQVVRINQDVLKEQDWEKQTALVIFPGGRDVAYHLALKGKGNQKIRDYVENGGRYLGLCAGGYYGCSSVEFEMGYPLEVVGKRELAFFPGIARGPAYGSNQFSYENESGSRAAYVDWVGREKAVLPCILYFNGGCEFVDVARYPNTEVLAHYQDIPNRPAAIIQCEIGKGRAILSGVHPEYPSSFLEALQENALDLTSRLREIEECRTFVFTAILHRLLL
ncbi:MAG: BPL-N domain-containing protein [Waddliaceae bacterium]